MLESRGAVLSLMLRGVEIVWNLGFYWSSLVYDYLVGRDEEVVPFRARQLRTLLCDLGPSFIKAGQVCCVFIDCSSTYKLLLVVFHLFNSKYLLLYSTSSIGPFFSFSCRNLNLNCY